jgi:hypothetical protein
MLINNGNEGFYSSELMNDHKAFSIISLRIILGKIMP